MTFDPGWGGGGVVALSRGRGDVHYPRDHVTYPMMHLVSPPPPLFSDRMTDACENITFALFTMRAIMIISVVYVCPLEVGDLTGQGHPTTPPRWDITLQGLPYQLGEHLEPLRGTCLNLITS